MQHAMHDNLPSAAATARPRWRHVGIFLGLTFGLTWLLDLAIHLHGGLGNPRAVTALQAQMLLPAFCAILLGWRLFPESPIYHARQAGRGRWFFSYFLFVTVIYALGASGAWLAPLPAPVAPAAAAPLVLAFAGLMLLDQVVNTIAGFGFRAFDPVLSFGIGIYGLATLAVIALLILRDPIWRTPRVQSDLSRSRPAA